MAARITEAIEGAEVELIGGGRGVFTVLAAGTEVWNKHASGEFPDDAEVVRRIAAL